MIAEKKAALHDIYGIWHVPFWQRTSFYIGVGCVALGVIALGTFLFIKKMQARKRRVTFWQQAINELSALQYLDCTTRDKGKYLYGVMTGTLKTYMHNRYGFDVSSKTDEELIGFLKDQSINSELKEQLSTIFLASVLVKFAQEQALKTQVSRHIQVGLSFIKKTMPQDHS